MVPYPDSSTPTSPPEGARQRVEHADGLRARDSLEDAAREYRAILAAYPNDRSARRGLVATLVRTGDLEAALPIVNQLLREDENDLATWRDRSEIYRATGDPTELLQSLRSIVRLDPSDRAALWEEFRLLDVAGDTAEAYRCLEVLAHDDRVTEGVPNRTALLLRKAELAEGLGKSEEAATAYGEAVTDPDPAVVRAAALRGANLAIRTGRPDLALTILADATPRATVEGGAPTDLLRVRGEILLSVDRPEEAQEVYDALRARDPLDAEALAGAAKARLEQGKHPEARELLHDGLRRVPRTESLVLSLAEAESGSGDLTAAERAVVEGIEILPTSRALWVRLAEIASARSDWERAADAYRHAMELDPAAIDGLLGAAFVAEQQEHPAEALNYYDRAAELAPKDVRVWTRRGLALAALQRHADAVDSFDRALAIDPESDAAREGKKLADRERRSRATDGYALAALRLENQLGRPVTKNDLFVQLKVPFDQLDPVMERVGRELKVDVGALEPAAFAELERRSCRLITTALADRPQGLETRGLTVAVVAALAPPNDSLTDVQRLFAYVDTVLRMDIRPENLRLTPESEEVARRALALPAAQRTLFGLVRTLQIGIFQARVVKAVERTSESAHAPLPSVNLSSHSPEFGSPNEHADGDQYFRPENVPVASPGTEARHRGTAPRPSRLWPLGVPMLETQRAQAREKVRARCVACGGIASLRHGCGAALCVPCTRQFQRCPKCGAPFYDVTPAAPEVTPPPTVAPKLSAAPTPRPAVALLPQQAGLAQGRARPSERAPPSSAESIRPAPGAKGRVTPPSTGEPRKRSDPDSKEEEPGPRPPAGAKGKGPSGPVSAKVGDEAPAPAVPTPRPRREKADDEPRL